MEAKYVWLAFSAGAMWVVGAIAYSVAVDLLGITRSTPVKNLGPLMSTLFGIVLFAEFSIDDPTRLALAVFGSVGMALAAVLIGRCAAPDDDLRQISRAQLVRGFALALLAGLLFGAYTVPVKIVQNAGHSSFSVLFLMGLSIPVAALVLYAVRMRRILPPVPSRKEFWRCQGAGAAWVGGGGAGILAMDLIPMSVVWPITNLSALVTVAFGVWLFREVHLERHRSKLFWGCGIYTVGVVLLGLALS
jgi:glucose uptake protein GlcU